MNSPSRNHPKLNSAYVRAWCEEWAMIPATIEQALIVYATAKSDSEVIRCLCRLAAAQRTRLMRTGQLRSLDEFLQDPSRFATDPLLEDTLGKEAKFKDLF